MMSSSYRGYALACIVILVTALGTVARITPDTWIKEIGAPQYVAVLVEDVDESVRWYRTAFGLHVLDDSRAEDGAWRIVNLSNEHLFVEIVHDDGAVDVDRSRGFFKVGFRVPDVEVVADRVEQATGERPRIVDLARHELRILQLRDPDENIIQLSSKLEKDPSAH